MNEKTTQAVVHVNEQARVDGLRRALSLLAVISMIALLFTRRIPSRQPATSDPSGPDPAAGTA